MDKKGENTILLKIIGLIINLGGIVTYSIYNIKYVLSSVIEVNNVGRKTLFEVLDTVSKSAMFEMIMLLGDVCLFEFINYILYLLKKKQFLIYAAVIELIAFIVGGIKLGFGYPLLYVTLLPIVNAGINYLLLKKEGK